MTEEQIIRLYGRRCAEHCDDCCVCEVWAMHDLIETLETQLESANEALRERLDICETQAREIERLREALEWALAQIEGRTKYDREDQFENCLDLARAALAGESYDQ